jgi:hypothetical protein
MVFVSMTVIPRANSVATHSMGRPTKNNISGSLRSACGCGNVAAGTTTESSQIRYSCETHDIHHRCVRHITSRPLLSMTMIPR